MSNNKGYEGYDKILKPIAEQLKIQRHLYPMTIIYTRLRYCGYAYKLLSKIMDEHFVSNEKIP